MALFGADINLTVTTTQAERKIARLEKQLDRLQNPRNREQKIKELSQEIRVTKELKSQAEISEEILRTNRRRVNNSRNLFKLEKLIRDVKFQQNRAEKAATKELEKQNRLLATQKKQRAADRGRRAQNVALGAGFPLLFGGGAGSVLGGALGGALGGFGGSVIASALGGIFDRFIADIGELGDALGSASGAVEELTKRNLFSSKESEELANKLIRQGEFTKAAALASEELTKALGPDAIRQLKELDKVTDELNGEWQKLTIALGLLVAGPLTDAIRLINGLLQGVGQASAFRQLEQVNENNPEYQRRRAELSQGGRNNRVGLEGQRTLLNEFGGNQPTAQITPSAEELEDELDTTKDINKALREQLAIRNQIRDILISQRNTQVELVRITQGDTAARQLEREAIALNLLDQQAKIREDIAAKIREQPENTQVLLDLEQKQLTLARSKAELQYERVKQLDREAEVQRDIYRTETARQAAATQRGLDRDITGAQSRLDNFGDSDALARSELAIRQANRFNDAIRENVEAQEDLEKQLAVTKGDTERAPLLERQKQLQDTNTLLRERLPLLDQLEQKELAVAQAYEKIKPVADAVAQSAINGIRAVIEGTATAEEAFASFLNTIVDLLLKAAAEQIAAYIAIGIARQFAGMGGGDSIGDLQNGTAKNPVQSAANLYKNREVGGRTMANMPYVVGEKGPELFVPGKTGTVVPADVFDATRQAINGNGPEGGDTEAFDQNSVALGSSASITRERSLERAFEANRNDAIDVRYESTVINSVEYVTADQFQKGIKDSVNQSRASVYKDLRNKPAARSGVGI